MNKNIICYAVAYDEENPISFGSTIFAAWRAAIAATGETKEELEELGYKIISGNWKNAEPTHPDRSPKTANQNQTQSKPESEKQPRDEGLSSSVLFAGMYLCDRADGVRGHFCIGRHMEKYRHYPTPTWEYWTGEKWSSFGKVYNREEAIAVRVSLANS